MTLDEAVDAAVKTSPVTNSGPEEVKHTPNDLVLVTDTSFLTRLSNRNIWAYQTLLMTQNIAKEKGKRWLWRAPKEVMDKYNAFLASGRVDDYGIPVAQCSLEELFGEFTNLSFHISAASASEAARIAPGKLVGREDLSLLTFASGLMNQGVEVYVASYDIKDVIVSVRLWNKKFVNDRQPMTPLPPSRIITEYFREAKLEFRVVVTGDVIRQLQSAKSSQLSYPIVIFEKGIRSGDAVFDAGVGVVEKQYFRPLQLPPQFNSISENYRAIPVLRVKSLKEQSVAKEIGATAKQFNVTQLLVVEDTSPYSPSLVSTFAIKSPAHIFRADPDFLYWQTNKTSAFAQANYMPVAKRPLGVSIQK